MVGTFKAGFIVKYQEVNSPWVDTFSGVGVPKLRFQWNVNPGSLNFWRSYGRTGFSHNVLSSDGVSFKSIMLATRLQDGGNDFDAIHKESTTEGGVLLGTTTGASLYYTLINSWGTDEITVVTTTLTSSNPYMTAAWNGSMDLYNGLADTMPGSVGQSTICSVPFKPDLIYIQVPWSNNENVNTQVFTGPNEGYSKGWYNVRSSFGRFLNRAVTFGSTEQVITQVNSKIMRPAGTGGYDYGFSVKSIGGSGFYIECDTVNVSLTVGVRFSYLAVKFNDPTIKFGIYDYQTPSSSEITSLNLGFAPRYVDWIGSDTRTFAHDAAPTNTAEDASATHGAWAEGSGYGMSIDFWQNFVSPPDTAAAVSVDWPMGHYGGDGASPTLLSYMTSLENDANFRLKWYTNISTTQGVGARSFLMIVGDHQDLPTRVGTPTLRTFPTTENRGYPTPTTSVRKFPVD
jgi:hypothetical protein